MKNQRKQNVLIALTFAVFVFVDCLPANEEKILLDKHLIGLITQGNNSQAAQNSPPKPVSDTPDFVYGQPDFVSGSINQGGSVSANTLYYPAGMRKDASGKIYIADTGNNRVLVYPLGSNTATGVYGQPDLISSTLNNMGSGAQDLRSPLGLFLDSSDSLYVVDEFNDRVLVFPSGSTTATAVYGQGSSGTSFVIGGSGTTSSTMYDPVDILKDSSGKVYVSDNSNNRVLLFPANTYDASSPGGAVYGQSTYTSGTANAGGINATSLSSPNALAMDSSENLYIADNSNHRVLYFPKGSIIATKVFGQPDFTSASANQGGSASANTLNFPDGLALDSYNNLYVSDSTNQRILYFPVGSTTATKVYGQVDFTSTAVNGGSAVGPKTLNYPFLLFFDSSTNSLYVSDNANSRVLHFPPG